MGGLGGKFPHKLPDMEILRNLESPFILWIQIDTYFLASTSYVAGDKTFCIYLADDEALIHEHAERSGFPASIVTEVRKMIDPVTAEG